MMAQNLALDWSKRMSRILDVYLHQKHSGQLIQDDSGRLIFTYDETYVAEDRLSLSLSLPLRHEPYEGNNVKAFFSGLLPDNIVRHRLARYLGVSEKNPFSLLEAIGGECAGALSLYPEGAIPPEAKEEDAETLDDHKLKEILELLKRRPLLAGEEGLRLSLAGAQDKIAVGVKDGKIALVKGTTPTTHILKPLIAEVKDSVHNELFCLRLAKLVGIETPHAEIRTVNDTSYFLIERYDRIRDKSGQIHRLHQEDFCQALGIMPDMKYEREGGPSLTKCQAILGQFSAKPAVDQMSLLERVIFNYLIGNADAHGKNFSLLYKEKKPELAPAYDLLSTAVYPDFSVKMAMKIGGTYEPEHVFLRHWHRLVPDMMATTRNIERQLLHMSKDCGEKAYELKTSCEKEGLRSSVFEDICTLVSKRIHHIKEQVF